MRVLNVLLAVLLIVSTLGTPFSVVGSADADPPSEPDHGIEPATFWTLWSGDSDDYVTESEYRRRTGETRTPMQALANGTDISFAAPPAAAERWTRRDFGDFPATNRNTSIKPPFAEPTDGRFIRDAHASIFAIQPSTHLLRTDHTREQLVRDEGTVLGVVDYRVAVPDNDTAGDVRTRWELESHEVSAVRLRVDGEQIETANGSHTARIAFSDLPGKGGHELRFEAELRVRLERSIATCRNRTANGTCERWHHDRRTVTETLVVGHDVFVSEYDPTPRGRIATFPDGDLGVRLRAEAPWRAISTDRGTLNTRWRFYTARNPAWDELEVVSASGTAVWDSPMHPVEVYAYPGPTPPHAGPGVGTVLAVRGQQFDAPRLGEAIDVDVASGQYRTADTLVARLDGGRSLGTLQFHGLVRGSGGALTEQLRTVRVRPANLTVAVANVTGERITVTVRLRDARTGRPIATADSERTLLVNGQRVETDANGTATTTLPRGRGGITARFEPAPWWQGTGRTYAASSDVAHAGGPSPDPVDIVNQVLAGATLLLLPLLVLDRLLPSRLWPPWRRM